MNNLWYDNHRLLMRGSHGDDVKKVQHALNDMGATPSLVPDGDYGEKTERRIIDFQRMFNLVDDGKVGAVTYAVLTGTSLRYELTQPPFVPQGTENLCWAASLESVLKGPWPNRPHLSVSDLRAKFSMHLKSKGDISITGIRAVGLVLRFEEAMVGKPVRAEFIIRLLRTRLPLLLIDSSTGSIMHTRVVYGVHIKKGSIDLLVMDPMRGYQTLPIGDIQAQRHIGFLKAL